MSKLKRFSQLAKNLDAQPGFGRAAKAAKKVAGKIADRLVNARGKGVRFIRRGGRIIPIRPRLK